MTPLNTLCPWSKSPVQADSLAEFRGQVIGFCNTGCRDEFVETSAFLALDTAQEFQGMTAHFARFARYNYWINRKIFDGAAKLSSEDVNADRGAFFGSVLATLNHIALIDVLWLQRVRRGFPKFTWLDHIASLEKPTDLSAIIADNLADLTALRVTFDAHIAAYIAQSSQEDFEQALNFTTTEGTDLTLPLGGVLAQVFNHQTHHRGQVTTLLSQFGIEIDSTDMGMMLIEEAYS